MATEVNVFKWPDYLVFSLSCAMTVIVGLVFAIKDKWGSQNAESYLMGNRNMSWLMIGISSFASIVSAVVFVGPVAEFYYMGLGFIWMIPGSIMGLMYTSFITIPKFFRLGFKITSAYEYLEVRFSLPVRMLASGIYSTATLLFMAVILYAPCLILAQVSDLDIRICVFIGAAVCLIYTGFGGLKAVVWVDNIQTLIMVIGLVVLAVKGVVDAGGLTETWNKYKASGRHDIMDFNMAPWDRHNFWNLMIIGWIMNCAGEGSQQLLLQRYMAVKSMRHAQRSAIAVFFMFPIFFFFIVMVSMAAFAQVGGNEPLLTGEIKKPGQIFPYYMMHALGHLPGLPGLLVAAAFAAALSSLSSGQNSLAAVILEDFVKPIHYKRTGVRMSEATAGKVSRLTGVGLGFVIMSLSLAVLQADDMVFSLVRTMESLMAGPIFSMIVMAMFLPYIESWGAFIGGVCSLLWAIQMVIGALFNPKESLGSGVGFQFKPLYLNNFTREIPMNASTVQPTLYHTSYRYYVPMDLLVGVIVASIVSLTIHAVKYSAAKKVNPSAKFTDNFTGTEYCYSKADFLAGIGCMKDKKKADEESVELSDRSSADGTTEKVPFIDRNSANATPEKVPFIDTAEETPEKVSVTKRHSANGTPDKVPFIEA